MVPSDRLSPHDGSVTIVVSADLGSRELRRVCSRSICVVAAVGAIVAALVGDGAAVGALHAASKPNKTKTLTVVFIKAKPCASPAVFA